MNTKRMIFISLFTAILCVLSPITVPLGPVPLTLSLFAVILISLILPKYDGVIATVLYILLGSIGLPVFSGFKAGPSVIFGLTSGFIWSYPLMAFIIGKFKNKPIATIFALIVCYIMGAVQFFYVSGLPITKAIYTGVLPFIPFDIIKLILALFISKPLKKACASFYEFS